MAFRNKQNSGNKKRILIVSTVYFPLVSGAEIAIKEITDRADERYSFDLMCARVKKGLANKELIGNVLVERRGMGSRMDKYLLPFWVFIKGLVGNYDAVWVVMASYGSFSVPFIKMFRPKTKFLLTLQEGDSEEYIMKRLGIFYPLYKLVFKKADYVQAISNYLADFARRHGARCPMEVIPNGVDLKKFEIQNTKQIQNSKELTIITTSRLVYKNGIDVIIGAVAELIKNNFEAKAVIIGTGPDREKLKNLARELGVEDVVKFTGFLDLDKIPNLLIQADVFARPSRSEGLGNSFLEAMAVGLPVIGTDVGGIPDFLKDGETGLFTKVDDPKDLAKKVELVINNRELREKIIKNGKELVFSKYSWKRVAGDMNKIFNKLIG